MPYRAAHRMMYTPSELRLVKGVTPTLYNSLQPFVTALPEVTQININTAPAEVLMLLSPTMTPDIAKSIVALRSGKPFVTPQAFADSDIAKNHQITADKVTVLSSYFLVVTNVTIENQHLVLYTLLQRAVKDKKAIVNILWQSKGVW